MNKAQHVLSQTQTREHYCHWPDCQRQVPPAMWGCTEHWKRLPKHLKRRIWATYRPGQENDLNPSQAYIEAAQAVQFWIVENEASY